MRLFLLPIIACSGLLAMGQSTCQEAKYTRTDALTLLKSASQASRSDSIDLLHTRIELDLTQTGTGQIAAHTTVRWTPKIVGLDHLPLDLLALTVDSVTDANGYLTFSHIGEELNIDLGVAHGPGDTLELTVHYHGDPVIDGSGWGGFYTSGNILYDLGVAFESQPHSFGRAWFPCFDNFVERCSFEFIVRTNSDRHAWCNGTLLSETDLGGGVWESHWVNDQTMPSYLASVTASTYAEVRDTFPSTAGGQVPVTLVAQPGDTTEMKNSFAHLQDAFDAFEQWFGPYRWDRMGYCLTPEGAMEHACNISYPTSIVDGSLTYEATMAHELAHMWFGDQVTCDRAEEMYINEGFAEYLSYLFLETVHGRDRYMTEVRDNHRAMVHRSHFVDEGWWALADMPQDFTYGTITYNKGADVLHSLRSYLGDTLFSSGLTSFLNTYAFQPVNSVQLRDHLTAATGVDMTDFFNDWIFQPGWAAFEVDSFHVAPGVPDHDVTVFLEQKLRGPSSYYHGVPVTVTLNGMPGEHVEQTIMMGGQFDQVVVTVPFIPSEVLLNEDERISLAITTDRDSIVSTGVHTYTHADLRLTVNSIPSAATVMMQEYWVAADDNTAEAYAYVVSPDRWWRVTGNIPLGSDIDCRITFDGRSTGSSPIDIGLVADAGGTGFQEDSVVVLYRGSASFPWTEVGDYTVNTIGSAIDGFGRIDFSGFRTGDYTLGWRKSAVGISNPGKVVHDGWFIFPNPAAGRFTVEWRGQARPPAGTIQVLDSAGREIMRKEVRGDRRVSMDPDRAESGALLLQFTGDDGTLWPIGKLELTGPQ